MLAVKHAVGTKRRTPSVLELLTAQGVPTAGVAFKAGEGAAQVMKAQEQNQASKASELMLKSPRRVLANYRDRRSTRDTHDAMLITSEARGG